MKLSTKIAGISMLTIMIAMIPIALAGVPPHFLEAMNPDNNIMAPVFGGSDKFDSSANIYFGGGILRTIEEAETDSAPAGPYKIKLWIDGEKIPLQRFSAEAEGADPARIWVWYHIFGPDYFSPGEIKVVHWQVWIFRAYEGDPFQYWRISENYEYTIYFE